MRLRLGRTAKYRNKKTELDGFRFDSKREAQRYQELKFLEKAGKICRLEIYPRFTIHVKGDKICTYIADFKYMLCDRYLGNPTGAEIVEDVKGIRTQAYILKKKLMKAVYGIEITEIN